MIVGGKLDRETYKFTGIGIQNQCARLALEMNQEEEATEIRVFFIFATGARCKYLGTGYTVQSYCN